jgi:hypothetical protein
MHGLEQPPSDPPNIAGWVIGVVVVAYVLARIAFEIWEAWQ